MTLLIIFLLFSSVLRADSIFEAYQHGDFEKAEKELLLEQVQDPFDSVINYNLGTVQYKRGVFADARESFKKAIDHAEDDLKEHSLFNQGNSLYKNTLAILGDDWENKKIEDPILENAIAEVKESIMAYKDVLELDEESDRARVNLGHAEDLLKKLEQKKKQQQDKQNDQKNEQDKNQDKNDQNQNKDNQDQKSDKKPQDGNNQNDEKKDQGKENQKNDKQSDKDDKPDGQQNEQNENGNSDEQKDEHKEKNEQQKDEPGEQKEQQQQKPEQQQQGQSQENDMELRSMKALLDSLDDREGKLQKALMKQKSAQAAGQSKTMKNW